MTNKKEEVRHIKKMYRIKATFEKFFFKYLIFLILFFGIFYLLLNLNRLSYGLSNFSDKIYYKFIKKISKNTEIKKATDTHTIDTQQQTENIVAQKSAEIKPASVEEDKHIEDAYSALISAYKKKYGKNYEAYLKKDAVNRAFIKYYERYGNEAEFYMREDFNANKPDVPK